MKFSIIAYKPNSESCYGGHVEARYSSRFHHIENLTCEESIKILAEIYSERMNTDEEGYEYISIIPFLLDDNEENEVIFNKTHFNEIQKVIQNSAKNLSIEVFKKKELSDLKEKEEKELKEKEELEQLERKQYEKLRRKYGK